MDDLVKLLTDTRLEAVPNTSKRMETDLDNEKKYLVCTSSVVTCSYYFDCYNELYFIHSTGIIIFLV